MAISSSADFSGGFDGVCEGATFCAAFNFAGLGGGIGGDGDVLRESSSWNERSAVNIRISSPLVKSVRPSEEGNLIYPFCL